MKTTQSVNKFVCALAVLMLGFSIRAGSIIYNFNSGHDYVANGVLGTFWDGVYLGNGDIPLGNNGGSVGVTSNANENIFPNFIAVSSRNTGWAGAEDDGFLLYKIVAGDFDVSVQIGANYDNRAFNQSGLLVRAMTTNGPAWGAPFATTVTNRAENWVSINRFNEFSINQQYRSATNNTDIQITVDLPASTNYNIGTNDQRYVRITRTGNTFSVYDRTNITDPWNVQQTVVRGDLAGIPMQVGIHQAEFAGGVTTTTYYTDFELSGTNVNVTTPPADATGLATSAPDPLNGLTTLSWTNGAGADGTLILLQRSKTNFTQAPISGFTFNGATNFGSGDFLNGNNNSYVVYVGTNSSVTISGLLGSNNVYSAAAFSYTGSGSSIVYGTNPALVNFSGPGYVTNVTFSIAPTNLPLGGVGVASIRAQFSTGDTTDVSSDPNAVLSSSDSTIVLISSGLMNALALGSVQIAVGYAGIAATNTVSVHNPVFTDSFATSQDYVANGLMGSTWDGLFLNFGDVPGANRGPDNVAGSTTTLDANISNTNRLSLVSLGGTWRSGGNDGPFLFKIVTGDFQAMVHITNMNTLNFNAAGVMARLFNNPATGPSGGGGGAGGSETHVEWWKIQGVNGALSRRYTINGTHTGLLPNSEVAGVNTADTWLLMQRVNSTNFLFFEKANPSDVWTPVPAATCVIAGASSNAPMEVGISQEIRQATIGTVQFDDLMIDGPGIGSPTGTPPPPAASKMTAQLNNDLSMTFTWVATDATGTNPVRSALVMRAGGPITAQPTALIGANFGGGTFPFGTGPSLGGGNFVVFVTSNPAASTNVTATVTGLTPGTVYYAAVYTFVGAGGTKNFNDVLPPSGANTNAQDGVLLGLTVLPIPSIPLGGLQIVQVIGNYQGGATLNVSAFASITSANPAIVQTTNGAVTGMGLGSTSVTVVYSGQTNVLNVTVRPPTFKDDFNVSQDYVLNRTTNSPWDGVYLNQGDIPETGFTGTGQTLGADSNISSNNVLTVTNSSGGWAGDQNDGFFLFKYIPGDFQMVVHVLSYQISAYNEAGILARLYSLGTNGTDFGAPFVLGTSTNGAGNTVNNGETWVGFTKFDEFTIGTYGRKNIDDDEFQFGQNNQNSPDNWLLLVRQNATNFFFYERATNTQPWRLTPGKLNFSGSGALPDFAGQPLQVGIQVTPYTPSLYAQFEHFMLDSAPATLQVSRSGGNITLSWPAVPGVVLKSTPTLVPPNWQPVGGTPSVAGAVYSLTLPATDATRFFRLYQ
jgi:hypothetical protein